MQGKHKVKQKIIRSLPTLIKDSVMAIDRGNQITIITDEPMIDTKGNPSLIIVGVHKDVEMDGEIINLAKSVYPLDNLRNVIFDRRKNLVITDKNRADKILAGVGIPSPERTNIVDSAKGSISQNESLSQEQKSGKEAENLYEQIYRGNDRLFYGNFKGIKSAKGKDIWNSIVLENRGYDDGNGGKIGTERPGNNAGGSGANLPGSNSKVSLNLSTRIASDTEYMELAKEPEDTDVRFSTKQTKEI